MSIAFALTTRAQSPTADDFNPGANGLVYSLAVQADGKIVVGGAFTTLGGQSRNYIGRLHADGALDTGFNPGANDWVNCLAVQADGKILVGGQFIALGGQSRSRLGRLNLDGALDTSFNPGAGWDVYSLAVQGDGKIVVGGRFTTLGGQPSERIGRLNPDGTLDTSFNPGAGGSVFSLAVQADGKILVGGSFTTLAGQSRTNIGRLNPNGTLDTSFNPGASGSVSSLAVQADGKILVGGSFTNLAGQSRTNIGRLNPNGTLDTSFNPGAGGFYDHVNSLVVQADGKILVGGRFTTLGGQSRNYIGRLNPNGTLDPSFNPGAVGVSHPGVYSLAVQTDGKILVGGAFTTLAEQSRNYIGRLNNTDPATQDLSFDGTTITWLRGGTSPEVWRTTFDASTNGTDWLNLGSGTRIPGGWQLTGLSLPTHANIRARGFTTGGRYNGSSWFVETIIGPPVILTQPASRTNWPGSIATFLVEAAGTAPLSYQWRKDGVELADGGRVSGANLATLTLANVLGADAGHYTVVISNALGSVTSAVARLTVATPGLELAGRPDSGPLYLILHGEPGQLYAIETSTNLVDWTFLTVLQTTNGIATLPVNPNEAKRFFRVQSAAPATVWLEAPLPAPDGVFRLSVRSPPGRVCELWATTNVALPLSQWTLSATLTNTTGLTQWTDPATNLQRRFYRARLLDGP